MDKFYTKSSVANYCLSKLNIQADLYIEPSAGNGSFFNLLPVDRRKGYDIEPACAGVIKQDFFTTDDSQFDGDIVYIGNPPFGRNSSMAVRFFNHCASNTKAQAIAFIVPKTFKKPFFQNKLSMEFSLFREESLPKESFLFNGWSHDVPCIFQVWVRKKREPIKVPKNIWFDKLTKKEALQQGDTKVFAIRRVGWNSGHLLIGLDYNENSTYFLKPKVKKLKSLVKQIDLKYIDCTSGVRSISIPEILLELERLTKK